MSASAEPVQATAEFWASSVHINNCLALVAFTILYYDYSLTIFTEIEYFWKSSNFSPVSFLFVSIRYYGLLGSLPIAVEYFADISEFRYVCCPFGSQSSITLRPITVIFVYSCRQLQTYHQAFAISSQTMVAILLVIRTYALYDRSRRILALLIVTHVGGGIACLIALVTTKSPIQTQTPLPFTFTGCDLSLTNAQGIHLTLAWGAMLWFDTTIFVLTLVQALRIRRYFPGGLLQIMFRDGTIYYGILVASNVTNIITFLITPSGTPLKGMETTLTNVLSTTLTSRLILNIRDPKLRLPRRDTDNYSTDAGNSTTAAPSTTSYMMSSYTLTQIETNGVETEILEDQGVV